jgi:hypothetical protein
LHIHGHLELRNIAASLMMGCGGENDRGVAVALRLVLFVQLVNRLTVRLAEHHCFGFVRLDHYEIEAEHVLRRST